jgi:hypothetical protein
MLFFENTKYIEKIMLSIVILFSSTMPVILMPKGFHEL